jgi:hypothetical protein
LVETDTAVKSFPVWRIAKLLEDSSDVLLDLQSLISFLTESLSKFQLLRVTVDVQHEIRCGKADIRCCTPGLVETFGRAVGDATIPVTVADNRSSRGQERLDSPSGFPSIS